MDLCANGSFNSEAIWAYNRKLAETYTDSIRRALPTRPQVALIYDEESFFWLKADCYDLTRNGICEQRKVFQSLGAQVGYYYIQDLEKIPDSVRLFVFVNPFYMNARAEAMVEAIKTGGRTLLWLYAPGYVNEDGLSLARMERITGFSLGKIDEATAPGIRLCADAHAITQWVGAQTFGPEMTLAPLFYGRAEEDKRAVALGHYAANGQPGLMLKTMGEWTSIFCGSPTVSTALLRGICREAGVELLVDPESPQAEDAVAFNGRYLFVYARGRAGVRQFSSPIGAVTVTDVMSGETLGRDVTRWSAEFKKNEERIFRLAQCGGA